MAREGKKRSVWGKIAFVALFFVIWGAMNYSSDEEYVSEEPTVEVSADSKAKADEEAKIAQNTADSKKAEQDKKYISLEEFGAVENGMTYEEVVAIVGGEGTVMSESGAKGDPYYTVMYVWYGDSTEIANSNMMFQGDKLQSKAQLGLK